MSTGNDTVKRKAYEIWIICTLLFIVISFVFFSAITIYIDPLFHYHKPLEKFNYPIEDERYQNDGIVRNFEYDSIITGTSMAENFMTSEADEIFGSRFIKIPFSGGRYKEINDCLKRGYAAGHDIKYVIRSLDYSFLIQDKDAGKEGIEALNYLYNNNPFDDLNYVLNKSIFFSKTWNVVVYTKAGYPTTSFDEYANWNDDYSFGREAVLNTYVLGEQMNISNALTEEERNMIVENVKQNITNLADEHPETTFYIFFPPYSICYWDVLKNRGETAKHIDAEKAAIEEIIKHSNIKLYSFCNNFELVCNLDNYKDQAHYGEWVNSWMLRWMKSDKYLLTENNYQNYIDEIREFYVSYNYDSLHK